MACLNWNSKFENREGDFKECIRRCELGRKAVGRQSK